VASLAILGRGYRNRYAMQEVKNFPSKKWQVMLQNLLLIGMLRSKKVIHIGMLITCAHIGLDDKKSFATLPISDGDLHC
jgi:hypothetical protein